MIFIIGAVICLFNLIEGERKKFEKMYQELNKEDTDIKKWNQAIISKTILLFPPIVFALTYLKINIDKSLIDLLGFLTLSVLLVSGGIFVNYLLSKSRLWRNLL